ncbi:MAG: hypothetical protein KDD65_01790 [Bacteroidetes bacterium]|nr:hypothetical protein [Bacteroidota bacterium]
MPVTNLRFRPFGFIAVALFVAGFAAPATGQIYKLPRIDGAPGDHFGVDVAIDSNRVLIGATGINACGDNAGAAYVYERDDSTGQWRYKATLQANDCAAGDFFGRTVALSGNVAVVSAFHGSTAAMSNMTPNAAYVFEPDSSGAWRQTARLSTGTDDSEGRFAADVAVDGNRIAISTAGDLTGGQINGAVYVYERSATGHWVRSARLSAPTDARGYVIGGSLSLDGDRVLVGASTAVQHRSGGAYIFDYDPATRDWTWTGRITGLNDFFLAADLDGDQLLIGERKAGRKDEGAASIYQRQSDGKWTKHASLAPSNPFELGAFGSAVAIEGGRALVVGYDEQLQFDYNIDRVVYVFEQHEDGAWSQENIIDVGEVFFGSAIDLDDAVAAIGQASDAEVGECLIVVLH